MSHIIERDNVTLSCDVDSHPVSDIKLYNMTDNTTIETIKSNNKASYNFVNIHCLDTGEYMFTARNSIPDESYIMIKTSYIDVMCMLVRTFPIYFIEYLK